MSLPKLSVLLCTNKVDSYLPLAINSILEQTFSDFELILVVNGLTDQNYVAIKEMVVDSRVKLIRTEIDGLTFSLNLGIHFSRAPLIVRMDADDIALPNRLKIQFEFMQENQSIDVCGTAIQLIDEFGRPGKIIQFPKDNQRISKKIYFSNPMCHPSIIFRKSVFQTFGGYMGGVYAEDYDLWVRMISSELVKFANLPEVLLQYRASSNGLARGSKKAYSSVSATQWTQFILTGGVKWLFASLISCLKRILLPKD